MGPSAPVDSTAKGGSAGEGAGANPESAGAHLENASPDPPPALIPDHCDLDGGCVSKCTNQTVSCAVEPLPTFCEFDGFTGASAPVTCGQRVVIGTVCCGACGCVPVEVFFDGTSCWQGIPQCTLPSLANQFFGPHEIGALDGPSTAPNNGVPDQIDVGIGGQSAHGTSAGSYNAGESEKAGATAGGASPLDSAGVGATAGEASPSENAGAGS